MSHSTTMLNELIKISSFNYKINSFFTGNFHLKLAHLHLLTAFCHNHGIVWIYQMNRDFVCITNDDKQSCQFPFHANQSLSIYVGKYALIIFPYHHHHLSKRSSVLLLLSLALHDMKSGRFFYILRT